MTTASEYERSVDEANIKLMKWLAPDDASPVWRAAASEAIDGILREHFPPPAEPPDGAPTLAQAAAALVEMGIPFEYEGGSEHLYLHDDGIHLDRKPDGSIKVAGESRGYTLDALRARLLALTAPKAQGGEGE